MIYAYFESIPVPEYNGKQNANNLIQTNIKNISLAVTAIKKYLLITSLVRLLSHTQAKMQFTILLII